MCVGLFVNIITNHVLGAIKSIWDARTVETTVNELWVVVGCVQPSPLASVRLVHWQPQRQMTQCQKHLGIGSYFFVTAAVFEFLLWKVLQACWHQCPSVVVIQSC